MLHFINSSTYNILCITSAGLASRFETELICWRLLPTGSACIHILSWRHKSFPCSTQMMLVIQKFHFARRCRFIDTLIMAKASGSWQFFPCVPSEPCDRSRMLLHNRISVPHPTSPSSPHCLVLVPFLISPSFSLISATPLIWWLIIHSHCSSVNRCLPAVTSIGSKARVTLYSKSLSAWNEDLLKCKRLSSLTHNHGPGQDSLTLGTVAHP